MIIIDSNIWIFGEIADAPEHEEAIKKYKESVQKDEIGINAIIASEVFHKLYRLYDANIAQERTNRILQDTSINCLNFSREMIIGAANMAKTFNLRINDALISQQAIHIGEKILTDDVKDFKKVKGLEIIPLR